MIFWIVLLAMLLVSVLSVLFPLLRDKGALTEDIDGTQVYRDQLQEIEQQVPSNDAERESLEIRRAEIARRLLKEARKTPSTAAFSGGKTQRGMAAFAAIIAIPVLAGATYYAFGSPGTPDFPLSARNSEKLEDKSIEEMVQIAERHLEKNPDDARGWRVLADVYGRTRRPRDRANALQQIIRISGRSPAVLADLGEALTVAEGNVVKDRAKNLFEEAVASDPKILKAQVYLALATEQEGRFEEALARWVALSKQRVQDPQWQSMTGSRIAAMNQRLGRKPQQAAKLGNPNQEDVNAASNLTQSDRTQMIEGMVAGLAEKLADEPDNLAGWMRLIRSYAVLKKQKKLVVAIADAKRAFDGQTDKLDELSKLEKQLTEEGLVPSINSDAEKQGADG